MEEGGTGSEGYKKGARALYRTQVVCLHTLVPSPLLLPFLAFPRGSPCVLTGKPMVCGAAPRPLVLSIRVCLCVCPPHVVS